MPRLGRRSASVAVVAALITAAGARAATPAADQWSGRWEVTFTTNGNGSERKAGPLCCVEVQQVSTERGLALARGETGDVANNPFTDVVCGQGAPVASTTRARPRSSSSAASRVVRHRAGHRRRPRRLLHGRSADAIRGHT